MSNLQKNNKLKISRNTKRMQRNVFFYNGHVLLFQRQGEFLCQLICGSQR